MTINYKDIIKEEINATIEDLTFAGNFRYKHVQEHNHLMKDCYEKDIIIYAIRLANALNEYKKLEGGKI